jgi:hypothetical protein
MTSQERTLLFQEAKDFVTNVGTKDETFNMLHCLSL